MAKRAPGFGGFKAPPSTDLIDQLLLEQDQNSIKQKKPMGMGRGGGRVGFGGFKAPAKTDMIDALLMGGDDDDDEEDETNESLKDDGKPAQIKHVERRRSEQQLGQPKSKIGLRHVVSEHHEQVGGMSHRRKNSEKSDDEQLNLDGLDDEDDEDEGHNPFGK